MRKKEILLFVTTQMGLKCIILRDISQTEKDMYYKIPLNFEIPKIEVVKMEGRIEGRGNGEVLLKRYKLSLD